MQLTHMTRLEEAYMLSSDHPFLQNQAIVDTCLAFYLFLYQGIRKQEMVNQQWRSEDQRDH